MCLLRNTHFHRVSSKGFNISLLLILTAISIVYILFYNNYTNVVRKSKRLTKSEPPTTHVRTEKVDSLANKSATISAKIRSLSVKRNSTLRKQAPYHAHLMRAKLPELRGMPKECTFPTTDPFDPDVMKLVKSYPPLDCSNNTPNVVYLDGDVFRVNSSKLLKALSPTQNFSHCWCKEIRRKDGIDTFFEFYRTTEHFKDSIDLQPWQENVVTECFDTSKAVISRSYFPLVRKRFETESFLGKNYRNHLETNSPLETLSILMIGIDGMSKQNFARAMPKTRNFLLKEMGAIELYKYNKLAFETFPNVLALLTGHTPKEFYRDWNYNKTEFMDQINEAFLWSDARKAGYRTGIMFDAYEITAFHYQKKGFKVSPVDYYQRPTVIASTRDNLMRNNNSHCVGDMPEVTQVHDYWLQLARTFGKDKTTPFFGYSFSVHLTHEYSDEASSGDEAYHKFLQDLVATNSLNNTVILWFSDHGPRFGALRESYHGRIETSTPCLFFTFPPWFHRKYPKLIATLRLNQNRLSSHFDVYETLRDILNFNGEVLKQGPGKITERRISLFREIPKERTCEKAGIPGEFCACGRFSKVSLNRSLKHELSVALLNKVNSFIGFLPSSVRRSNFSNTLSADAKPSALRFNSSVSGGNTSVLAEFNKYTQKPTNSEPTSNFSSKNQYGNFSHLCSRLYLFDTVSIYFVTNDHLKNSKAKSYRVTIRTKPGLGQFEGLVNREPGQMARVVGDVVRINLYRGQAECVHDPWLRQFCFCVKKV